MQRHTIKTTNIELTDAIRDYVNLKLDALEKLVEDVSPVEVRVDIGKTTNHHNKGLLFKCEINFRIHGVVIRVEKSEENLYKAIDKVKDHLHNEINDYRDKLSQKKKKIVRPGKE